MIGLAADINENEITRFRKKASKSYLRRKVRLLAGARKKESKRL